jgi:threonine synthase
MDSVSYRCPTCGTHYLLSDHPFRCDCGGYLNVDDSGMFGAQDLTGPPGSIWRYRKSFGLPENVAPVSMGEGNTPILTLEIEGAKLHLKTDFQQPSGSFKDRGASVLVSALKHTGVREVVEDSSGNAGAALSAYAAAAGIGVTVYVPAYTQEGKVVQIEMYGAKVVRVPGKRQDANIEALRAAQECVYASHLWNPYFIRGLSSVAYEIWEQMGRNVPQAVIVPVGSGGFLEGLHHGFCTLKRAGFADSSPRLIGVQAAGCAPIHRAFVNDMEDSADIEVEKTIAEGIAVQKPPRARAVLAALRNSGGYTVTVGEGEIIEAAKRLGRMGLFVEPTSASVLAAWLKIEKQDMKGALLVLTGSGLKAVATYHELHGGIPSAK